MKQKFKQFLKCLNSRLSHKIVGKIFVSIVAIEVVILVPSYLRRQRDLLENILQFLGSTQVEVTRVAVIVKSLRNFARLVHAAFSLCHFSSATLSRSKRPLSVPIVALAWDLSVISWPIHEWEPSMEPIATAIAPKTYYN